MLRKLLKKLLQYAPFPLSRNEYYDKLTERVIKKVCFPNSVCVDVGANNGKILQLFIKHCPQAIHFAFEPIPSLYYLLKRKFSSACNVYNIALANHEGVNDFNYVTTDPAYSGLKKRRYDKPETDTTISVDVNKLDNIIASTVSISLIKIDVEGGEFDVLLGAQKTIERCRPYILFEFGKGGSDVYGVTPHQMFALLNQWNYQVNLLPVFLRNEPSLSEDEFLKHYDDGREYFFIAYQLN